MEIKLKESFKWIAGIAVVFLVLAWVGRDNSQPQSLTSNGSPTTATLTEEDLGKNTFVNACVDEARGMSGARNYCICVWNDLRINYTVNELEKMGLELDRSGKVPANFQDSIDNCLYLVQ